MNRKLFRSLMIVSAVLLLELVLAACGGAAGGKPKVGISMPAFATERWQPEAHLMKAELETLGYEVLVQQADHDVNILWEWLHKQARFTADDEPSGVQVGDALTPALFDRLLTEEYKKLLQAGNKDVHDDSKHTTLPIAREIVDRYVKSPFKPPWYIDLLNLNLNNRDLGRARQRIEAYLTAFGRDGTRLTDNPDFEAPAGGGRA